MRTASVNGCNAGAGGGGFCAAGPGGSDCLVLTWANPHVYLDTVVLLGSISAQYHPYQAVFGVAAAVGSFSFFIALGYGARFLAPVFANPKAWVVLEMIVGCTMWAIAAGLAFGG